MSDSFSISEEHGIESMPKTALNVYSVGVSTAGAAEVRMAESNPKRHIIATTIDDEGVAATQKRIKELKLEDRIEIKYEDVASSLPYTNNSFDYVYARLVLHYLTKHQLEKALSELHRVLKSGGKLFVVVRSNENLDATINATDYDEETGMTTHVTKPNKEVSELRKRFFHSIESITQYISEAGFTVENTSQYDEKLYHDYNRTIAVEHDDNLIEVIASA